MNGWERLGIHKSLLAKEKSTSTTSITVPTNSNSALPINKRKLRVISVVFQAGPLGLKLKETKSCGGAVIITGFSRSESDEPYQAERTVLYIYIFFILLQYRYFTQSYSYSFFSYSQGIIVKWYGYVSC